MKKQVFFVGLLLFLFGSLRSFNSKTTELYLTGAIVTDEQLKNIANTCTNLNDLVLNEATGFTYVGLQEILDKCINLYYFSLMNSFIDFEQLNGNRFKRPILLNLSGSGITDKGLQNIVKNGSTVWFLALRATKINGEGVDWNNLSNLEKLDLSNSMITDESLEKIAAACNKLEDLDISTNLNITHKSVQYILNSGTKIVILSLIGCTNIDFEKLDWSKIYELKGLYLGFSKITDKVLEKISVVCKNLDILEIEFTNITKEGVQHILKKCVNVTHFNLSGCKNIEFEGLNWKNFAKLESLDLAYTNITELGLQKIFLIYPHLSYLDLRGCQNLRKEWQRNFYGEKEIQKLREQFNPFPDLARAFSAIAP